MGNSSSLHDPLAQLDRLHLTPQEKNNLQIFIWRSQAHQNHFIPRTKLSFSSDYQPNQQSFSCRDFEGSISPIITFEKYVCDFRPLAAFLNLAQFLTLFQFVIKGHQAIFSKFKSTLVHENCSFLTHNGEARIWINPNYFLNNFWSEQKEEFRLRTSSVHEAKCQTPRFMSKEEFEFEAITVLTSQGAVIRKIVNWMPKFAKKSKETIEFLAHLQKFIEGNILSNCNFERVQRFIHQWAYQKKIALKSNMEDTVKSLISEGKILKNSEKETQKLTRRRLSTNFTDAPKKQRKNYEITTEQEFDGISVFDIRNIESQHIYPSNPNLSYQMGKSENIDKNQLRNSFQRKSKITYSGLEDLGTEEKISLKERKYNHRRKAPNSFMNEQLEPCTQTVPQIEDFQSQKSVIYQNVDYWSVKSKPRDLSLEESRQSKRKMNLSYQYSIALINTNLSKTPDKEEEGEKKNLQASTDVSDNTKVHEIQRLRPRNNSKTGPILKKSNKSYDLSNEKSSRTQDKESTSKKRHPVIFETEKNCLPNGDEDRIESEQSKAKVLESRFGQYMADMEEVELPKYFYGNRVSQKYQMRIMETMRTADRTRENSSFETPKDESHLCPFKHITNLEMNSKKVYSKINLSSGALVTPESMNSSERKASMVNLNYLNDEIKQEIEKSKFRISLGGEVGIQKKLKTKSQDEYCKTSIINNVAEKSPKTIHGLFNSGNKLQTSFGSITSASDDFSDGENTIKYSGVLSKMGRSVQFRKTLDSDLQKSSQFSISSKNASEEMPNFTKKRSIGDGIKRSMKL